MCLVSTSVNLSNFNEKINESIYLRWTSCAVIVEMLWISKIYDSSPLALRLLLEMTESLTQLSQKTSKFLCATQNW
jgi:competence protein ComGF